MMRGPLTHTELAAVLDPDSEILDEIVSASQGDIVRAMATEIVMHRDAMAPSLLRATRLYTDELGALRKRVAELEAACRCGAEALRMYDPASPTAAELDKAALGQPSVYRAGNSAGNSTGSRPDDTDETS